MAKIEKAYSKELGGVMDSIEANELWSEGILFDKTAFECIDSNCHAQITCANMDKKKIDMKKNPYFQCYGEHSPQCTCKKDYMEKSFKTDQKLGGRTREYFGNIDSLILERPKHHVVICRDGKVDNRCSKDNKLRVIKEYKRKDFIAKHYSIAPIVSKYFMYGTMAAQNYVIIDNKRISYDRLFIPITSVVFEKQRYRHIYWGKAHVYRKKEKYIISFADKIRLNCSGKADYSVMCVISTEILDSYLLKNNIKEELENAVKTRGYVEVYLFGGMNQGRPEKKIVFINISSLDFIAIR